MAGTEHHLVCYRCKGEKKTAALKRIRKPIEELQKKLQLEWKIALEQNQPHLHS